MEYYLDQIVSLNNFLDKSINEKVYSEMLDRSINILGTIIEMIKRTINPFNIQNYVEESSLLFLYNQINLEFIAFWLTWRCLDNKSISIDTLICIL